MHIGLGRLCLIVACILFFVAGIHLWSGHIGSINIDVLAFGLLFFALAFLVETPTVS